jgi:transketolase
MASGSEVELILKAAYTLVESGINVRVVSFPSWELFLKQDAQYRESVFPSDVSNRIAVEAGVSMGWEKWVGNKGKIISVNKFGASAPYKTLYKEYGMTDTNIVNTANEFNY